jgi:hypothetical protein
MKCPGEETLAELAQGVLDEATLAQVVRHLGACEACRRLAAHAARAARSSRGDFAPSTAPTLLDALDATVSCRLARGAALGRYLLVDWLGRGGMGVVMSAYDPELDRRVALKVLERPRPDDDDLAYLLEEARAAARLVHPNVVGVYDVGLEGARAYIAMELVEGGTLTRWLRAAKRTPREILSVFLAAGEGLAAAHRARVVHRDFKPDNVLLGLDGRPRVADFGLAHLMPKPCRTSKTPTIRDRAGGTPGYMAPEQFVGMSDARSDAFAFCASLWEALTGKLPFPRGGGSEGILAAMREGRLEGVLPRAVSRRARRALRRGLCFRAEDRFPSMDHLLAELSARPSAVRPVAALAACGVGLVLWLGIGHSTSGAPSPTVALDAAGTSSADAMDAARWAGAAGPAAVDAGPETVEPAREAVDDAKEAPDAVPPPGSSGTAVGPSAPAPPVARPAKGRIAFRVNPWAEVTLDGRRLGPTPLEPVEMPAGRHVVVLENPELAARRTLGVSVREGSETMIKVNLLQ